MDLHEWQAKEILQKYNVPIPRFSIASTVEEVKKHIQDHDMNEAVIKIQVHAGGRGKAGGVRIAKSRDQILEAGHALLGMRIVNRQTGPDGVVAEKIMLTECISIAKEYYFGIVIDRKTGLVSVIVSSEGGVEIEELASKSPDKVQIIPIKDGKALRHYQLLFIAKLLGLEPKFYERSFALINGCVRAFFDSDALLLEINPLVLTTGEELYALDAKMSIDDNALFRQKKLAKLYDVSQISLLEARAKEHDLSYVALDGDIGCMVNGAGLAMATMDLIRYYGREPANFLDVGGSATEERVMEGFKILLLDPKVKAILVNIFGGIMNCEIIAKGLCRVAEKIAISVPVVVRMEGTNVSSAKEILDQASINVITADSLDDAAQKIVSQVEKLKHR
jgi:succinyl-CoA synthetase beta subunit